MRVLIAEDEALLRDGLALLLERQGFEVVGTVASADETLRAAEQLHPDLVITDIRMPPTNTDDGLRAALQLRASVRPANVLVLSQYVQQAYALQLLGDRSEGVGYLLKQRVTDVDEFCRAVRRVGTGGIAIDPEVVTLMVRRANQRDSSLQRLTPRQTEVLRLIAEGRSNLAVARALGITPKAVVRHVSNIYDLLGLTESDDDHRRVIAVLQWLSAKASEGLQI